MLGLAKGSAIAIDMPMSVTAVIAYLAIILASYVVVSIADSFAALEISTRLKIAKAKAIFTQQWDDHPTIMAVGVVDTPSESIFQTVMSLGPSRSECFGSTGEASSVDEYLWLMGRAHYKPVIEYCGGTEIGGGFVSGSLLQPQSLAAFSTPAMGCKLLILGSDGNPLHQTTPGIGDLALEPTMFGASTTLLNADHYHVYFRGMPVWNGKVLRRHGEEFERNAGGYYRAHGRADDTMNLGGIKVSSIEIEHICNGVDDAILETAAIGVPPPGGGPEHLVIAMVFKDLNYSQEKQEHLKRAFNSTLQKKLNPLFRVSSIVAVQSLPPTASNKIMRRVRRKQLSQMDHGAKL